MSLTLLYDHHDGLARSFILEDGRVKECFFDLLSAPQQSGSIYRGKVDRLLPNQKGAFIQLKGQENGYLNGAEGLNAGNVLLVQLKSEVRGQKGPAVNRNITLPGITLIHQPFGEGVQVSRRLDDSGNNSAIDPLLDELEALPGGWILRRAALNTPPQQVMQEAAMLAAAAQKISALTEEGKCLSAPSALEQALLGHATPNMQIIVEEGISLPQITNYLSSVLPALLPQLNISHVKNAFDRHDMEGFFGDLCAERVKLPRGGDIAFDQTEAMHVVDVNGGERGHHLDINLEAADILMRHLRWRNMGGAVVVDFLRMKNPEDKHAVADRLRYLSEEDALPCDIFGFTRMGLCELSRARRGFSLNELLKNK
jgi:ribonuclease E/ribonuclease G